MEAVMSWSPEGQTLVQIHEFWQKAFRTPPPGTTGPGLVHAMHKALTPVAGHNGFRSFDAAWELWMAEGGLDNEGAARKFVDQIGRQVLSAKRTKFPGDAE